uniref:Uncharacterized protein n=1 Tax=Aegilops tauschii subsp. strangulata TaxID=200361 RepID=A0A453K477_AEGTS
MPDVRLSICFLCYSPLYRQSACMRASLFLALPSPPCRASSELSCCLPFASFAYSAAPEYVRIAAACCLCRSLPCRAPPMTASRRLLPALKKHPETLLLPCIYSYYLS